MRHADLPIYGHRLQILTAVNTCAVTIVKGPTGCGKSTFIPVLLAESYRVAMVEPRRLAVLSLYDNIRQTCDAGYKIRFSKRNTDARVCIFTDGMFLKEKWDFDVIVIDEVHERTIRTDMILAMMKQKMATCTNRDVKLVLMSATVDTLALERYFGATVLEITCATFPLSIVYEEKPIADYVVAAFMKVREITTQSKLLAGSSAKGKRWDAKGVLVGNESTCKEPHMGDILVFLPGEEDINDLHAFLRGVLEVKALRVHSTLNDYEQKSIFEPSTLRKVILSTNICETSLTIPGVTFVIDCGMQKTKICMSVRGKGKESVDRAENHHLVSVIGIVPISRESADQRAGRSNRLCTGTVFRLYTKETYAKLGRTHPEIQTNDLRTSLLYLVCQGIDVLSLDLVDLPSKRNFRAALVFLWEMGFIEVRDNRGGDEIDQIFADTQGNSTRNTTEEPTREDAAWMQNRIIATLLGNELSHYPLDTHLAYFFHLCCEEGIQDTGAMLVSLMSLENHNFLPQKSTNDIQELLAVFRSHMLGRSSVRGMEKAMKIYSQLRKDNKSSEDKIERVFSRAFEYNASVRQRDGSYVHTKSGIRFHARSRDRKIVFVDLICVSRMFSRIVGKYYGV